MSIAIANIIGAGICFIFVDQLAKIALVRIGILAPVIIAITFVGAFQGSKEWGDLLVLIGIGVLGWVMKRLRWPRPPLILGFVLGGIFENNMFISIERYGADALRYVVCELQTGTQDIRLPVQAISPFTEDGEPEQLIDLAKAAPGPFPQAVEQALIAFHAHADQHAVGAVQARGLIGAFAWFGKARRRRPIGPAPRSRRIAHPPTRPRAHAPSCTGRAPPSLAPAR